jgi:membrane-associated phospholipid phosphatase
MTRRTPWIVAGAVSAVVFLALAGAVVAHPAPFAIDLSARSAIEGWHRPAMTVVTNLGSITLLLPLVVVIGLVAFVLRRDLRAALYVVATAAGAVLLYDIAKLLVARPRPPGGVDLAGYSFPSGHTVATTAVWGALAFLLARGAAPWLRWTLLVAAALIALVVGASRIALDAHWLTDVVGGLALGAAWLAVVTLVVWHPHLPPPTTTEKGETVEDRPAPTVPAGRT